MPSEIIPEILPPFTTPSREHYACGNPGRQGDAFSAQQQVASYLGLIPAERSSGAQRKLGAISKRGNTFLRTLLVKAAQLAVSHDEQFRQEYRHRCHNKARGVYCGQNLR